MTLLEVTTNKVYESEKAMAFQDVASLETETTVNVGGLNKKTGKPNPKSIEGYFIGTKGGIPNKFNPDKPNCIHVLQTPNGNVGVWGKTNMDQKMKAVTPGQLIRISFTGTKPSNKGNDMLLFKVEVDKDNTIEVDQEEASSVVSSDDSAYAVDGFEETDVDQDEESYDVVPPTRAVAPKQAAKAPGADRVAAIQARLNAARK
jgi:hypothetical protein